MRKGRSTAGAIPLLLLLASELLGAADPPPALRSPALQAGCDVTYTALPLLRFHYAQNADGSSVIEMSSARAGMTALRNVSGPVVVVGVAWSRTLNEGNVLDMLMSYRHTKQPQEMNLAERQEEDLGNAEGKGTKQDRSRVHDHLDLLTMYVVPP